MDLVSFFFSLYTDPEKETQHFWTTKKSKMNTLFFSVAIKTDHYMFFHNFLHVFFYLGINNSDTASVVD